MLKVTELFYSLQGEGLYTGTPSIFLRLFGCNFKCQGFGMPKGQLSNEYLNVDPQGIASINQLPLVHTGCDSYASWDPRFKHLSPLMTNSKIIDRIKELLPNKKFDVNKHLVITGGEPLLPGWQKQLSLLFDDLIRECDLSHITFETNATQKLEPGFAQYLYEFPGEITFSMSPKLTVSGEKWEDAIRSDVVNNYKELSLANSNSSFNYYFKFVIQNEQDIDDVKKAIKEYNIPEVPVYLMAVGGTKSTYNMNYKEVADIALSNGWRYSPRLHLDLYGNKWGT